MGGRLAIAAIAIALAILQSCDATVELVLAVHRHGARTVLVKNATSLAEGGASLTAQGADQLRTVGKNFRARYLDTRTCGTRCITAMPGGAYDGTHVRSISSGFDRTLASSISFGQGTFPAAAGALPTPIPVYATPPPDDWLIRAYENCPAYLKRMNAWFSSTEFKTKQEEVAPLLQELTDRTGANVTLPDFYNTFDNLNTKRDAVLLKSKLTLDTTLKDPIWSQVVDTANWLESRRYSREIAANLIGGSMINEVLYRLFARINNRQPAAQRVIEYSAHYPTIMAMLAALPLAPNATVFMSKIPAYGAVLAFELHRDGDDAYAVAAFAQDGANATYVPLPLPCAVAGDAAEKEAGKGACTYETFAKMAQPSAYISQGRWCAACNNTKMDTCAGIRANPPQDNPATYDFTLNKTSTDVEAKAATTASGFCDGMGGSGGNSGSVSNANAKIIGAAIGGMVGAAMLTAAVMALVLRGRRSGGNQPMNVQMGTDPYK